MNNDLRHAILSAARNGDFNALGIHLDDAKIGGLARASLVKAATSGDTAAVESHPSLVVTAKAAGKVRKK